MTRRPPLRIVGCGSALAIYPVPDFLIQLSGWGFREDDPFCIDDVGGGVWEPDAAVDDLVSPGRARRGDSHRHGASRARVAAPAERHLVAHALDLGSRLGAVASPRAAPHRARR